MGLKKIGKILIAVLFLGVLASCEPPEPQGPSQKIGLGTVAQYKISGQHYTGEVTHAAHGYTLWEFTWKKTPVFEFKSYRGLMTVYAREEGVEHWRKFDTRKLDAFFPLKVGKDVVIEGRNFSKTNEGGSPFYVTITVRDETEIMIKDKDYRVFILDYSVIEERAEGQNAFTMTVWYSPEMEVSLRTDYNFERGTFSMRIVSFEKGEGEDDQENQPEGLGTVRL